LSHYFPKDHWSQIRPPKVFASSKEDAMLVLDDYTRHAETRVNDERYTQVDVDKFALLVFPTPVRDGILPPADAIILEAPQGARLKFDDFRPELGRIGKVTGGQFPGPITNRSDMHEPGPEDDLLIETSDLQMNTKLLYSMSPVRFRMGPNVGGGRELEISFLIDEHVQPKDRKLNIAGIDTLEIRRDVRMRMELESAGLLPGGDDTTGSLAPRENEKTKRGNDKPPLLMEATCSGSFTFDFVRYVASLDRDVDLRQINANGPGDQLFCNKLDIHFAPKTLDGAAPPAFVDPQKRQHRDLGRLEPVAVEASGHPVIVNSPQYDARARGDRIQIALKEQRVRVAGTREATLVYGQNVLQAPIIDYMHPARDSATPIGRFRASGAGTLQYVPDKTKPDQVLKVGWQSMIDLTRENGQPVLGLEGRPQFAFGSTGALTADRMKIYLRELATQRDKANQAGITVSAGSGGGEIQLIPDRLVAAGNVEIQSPRLTGRTGELAVSFKIEAPPTVLAQQQDAAGAAGTPSESLADKLSRGIAAGPMQPMFELSSDRMKLDVALKGKSAAPKTLICDGNVVFREALPPGSAQQPTEIKGAQLTVDRLDTTPYITLKGGKAAGVGGPEKAELNGRGVSMHINVLELDAGENRMWSDGAGTATLLVTRDLQGQASATPVPLDLTWEGGLRFDGSTVAFDRDVKVTGADDRMQCDRMLAKLNTKIAFSEGIDQHAIDISEIHCDGRVSLNHLTRDVGGVTSHERMHLTRLSINQQTGAIHGVGPGDIRSTRFGDSLALLANPQNGAPSAPIATPGSSGSKLNFLRVDFHEGLTGNLITREMTFQNRVRAVYGPVDAWEQELDANQPTSLPPEAITMSSDSMRVNEDPVAARAMAGAGQKLANIPIQFQAKGNVRIDGQTPKYGPFTALADVASYEKAKESFVLQGDGRTPATLWRPGQTGPPRSAQWIRVVRTKDDIDFEVNRLEYLEITPEDLKNAQRPKAVR
jgi:hypothetical protein